MLTQSDTLFKRSSDQHLGSYAHLSFLKRVIFLKFTNFSKFHKSAIHFYRKFIIIKIKFEYLKSLV